MLLCPNKRASAGIGIPLFAISVAKACARKMRGMRLCACPES